MELWTVSSNLSDLVRTTICFETNGLKMLVFMTVHMLLAHEHV